MAMQTLPASNGPAMTITGASLPTGDVDTRGTAANLGDRQMTMAENGQWANIGITAANGLLEAYKAHLGFDLMKSAMDNQMQIAGMDFKYRGQVLDVQDHLINSQEKLGIQQLKTTERVAELQKERDIAVAKTRADASVKINRDTVLNSQFSPQNYGTPSQSFSQ